MHNLLYGCGERRYNNFVSRILSKTLLMAIESESKEKYITGSISGILANCGIKTGYSDADKAQLSTRIAAFLEML